MSSKRNASGVGAATGGSHPRRLLAALVSLAAALALAPGGGAAHPNLTLTVQLEPAAITPGQQALAILTFHNTSSQALTGVSVTVQLPPTLSAVGTSGCVPAHRAGRLVACTLGSVAAGALQRAFVVARVANRLPAERKLGVGFVLHVGSSLPVSSSATATVLGAGEGSKSGTCLARPRTLTATLDLQTTELPTPPTASSALRLPCTPLAVGVLPRPGGFATGVATVELPSLSHPARVVLRFPDELLPDEYLIKNLPAGERPSFQNPDPLWRVNPANPGARRTVVPPCAPGPRLPVGWQSCVAYVIASDADGDGDTGTVTLLVRGAGFGDPAYVG